MRAELALIAAGFDKLPILTAKANYVIAVNSAADALESVNAINGITIGATTPATGRFTTVGVGKASTLGSLDVDITGSGVPQAVHSLASPGSVSPGDMAGGLALNWGSVRTGIRIVHGGDQNHAGLAFEIAAGGSTTKGMELTYDRNLLLTETRLAPTAGPCLFVNSGALTYRGAAGTVTVLAPT